ncbi:HAMP domain-containing sensor histidine kinase [Maribellus sp. YY47]|uniref:sensor histidine kinase n=1 Tax=Maribellus sp. YY47 TaxID=2929486 RepID=UPI0020007D85|nr:HAMP domain-containing sensor histidine kinase [Maribellus sp. YY47]MCK3684767.1 HAMP domain-containing histidine kinase [Maribellus sp. YY47]
MDFAESVTQMVLILNRQHEILYANESYLRFIGVLNLPPDVIFKKPGNAFNCTNAVQAYEGCGTSEFCKSCGALNAILFSKRGIKATEECKIMTIENDAIDLRVTASPFQLDGEELIIFSITDISNEKRRESLERVFIHDLLNSAGGISGLSAILKEMDDLTDIKDIADTIQWAANNLIEEIQMQREIVSAEKGDLVPQHSTVDTLEVLQELKKLYKNHQTNRGKPILLDPDSEKLTLVTDKVLLKRILGNMIKNALEVNVPNDCISLKCVKHHDKIQFSIHNCSCIPRDIQAQLFKRFYSTKGGGRGIGTYSMKLFGEKYLKGKVGYNSTPEKGTTFFFEI